MCNLTAGRDNSPPFSCTRRRSIAAAAAAAAARAGREEKDKEIIITYRRDAGHDAACGAY